MERGEGKRSEERAGGCKTKRRNPVILVRKKGSADEGEGDNLRGQQSFNPVGKDRCGKKTMRKKS